MWKESQVTKSRSRIHWEVSDVRKKRGNLIQENISGKLNFIIFIFFSSLLSIGYASERKRFVLYSVRKFADLLLQQRQAEKHYSAHAEEFDKGKPNTSEREDM